MTAAANRLVWALQILLALAFLAHGVLMLFPPAEVAQQMNATLPRWFQLFISIAEILAAIGITLPGITGIQPWLVSWAAGGSDDRDGVGDDLPSVAQRDQLGGDHRRAACHGDVRCPRQAPAGALDWPSGLYPLNRDRRSRVAANGDPDGRGGRHKAVQTRSGAGPAAGQPHEVLAKEGSDPCSSGSDPSLRSAPRGAPRPASPAYRVEPAWVPSEHPAGCSPFGVAQGEW